MAFFTLFCGIFFHSPFVAETTSLGSRGRQAEGQVSKPIKMVSWKEENTTRTIWSVETRQNGPRITIEIAGNGFLYKMVRLMVGAIARVALGKMKPDEITARLDSGQADGFRFVAPADGLYLVKIWY